MPVVPTSRSICLPCFGGGSRCLAQLIGDTQTKHRSYNDYRAQERDTCQRGSMEGCQDISRYQEFQGKYQALGKIQAHGFNAIEVPMLKRRTGQVKKRQAGRNQYDQGTYDLQHPYYDVQCCNDHDAPAEGKSPASSQYCWEAAGWRFGSELLKFFLFRMQSRKGIELSGCRHIEFDETITVACCHSCPWLAFQRCMAMAV